MYILILTDGTPLKGAQKLNKKLSSHEKVMEET
jgi:hypothetical protein